MHLKQQVHLSTLCSVCLQLYMHSSFVKPPRSQMKYYPSFLPQDNMSARVWLVAINQDKCKQKNEKAREVKG